MFVFLWPFFFFFLIDLWCLWNCLEGLDCLLRSFWPQSNFLIEWVNPLRRLMLWGSGSLKSAIYECWEKNMATLGGIINWNQHVPSPLLARMGRWCLGGVDKPLWGMSQTSLESHFGGTFLVLWNVKLCFALKREKLEIEFSLKLRANYFSLFFTHILYSIPDLSFLSLML